MIDTILTESADELKKMLSSEVANWKRLRYLQQILKSLQMVMQIEGQVLNNRQKQGELLLLQHELKTLVNFIRGEGGSVHRFRLRELGGRTRTQQIIRHGLGTGTIKLIPAETGSNDLDVIKIDGGVIIEEIE